MKLVKNLVSALVLASFFAVNAPAGEINTPGAVASPTPPPPQVMFISDDGTVVYDPNPENTDTSDYLLLETLAALLSMY